MKQKTAYFIKKLDINNIGIAGHSQGGVAAINAATEYENSDLFSSIYTASCTHLLLAESLKWTYDVSKINIPYFMVSGTGKVDSETITPLSSLEENMDLLNAGVLAVYARRKDADHGEMLAKADGYMTAWFRYTLMNDNEAKKVFLGDTPELENNSENWTDVKINAY